MGKALTTDQVKANERIYAWLKDQPYREYAGQSRARVPQLTAPFVLRTYTPPNPEWSEQYFTPLEAGREALRGVVVQEGDAVLEPCAGIGHLLYCLPAPLCRVVACEIGEEACRIGARLFPRAEWRNQNIFDHADDPSGSPSWLPGPEASPSWPPGQPALTASPGGTGRHAGQGASGRSLVGRFDLVICNPPYGGGKHLGPQDTSGWHAKKTEYLFLELAARALKPGGSAVFIAPHNFADAIPPNLKAYLLDADLVYSHRGEKLPGDFLQTGVAVYAFTFVKAPAPSGKPDVSGASALPQIQGTADEFLERMARVVGDLEDHQ